MPDSISIAGVYPRVKRAIHQDRGIPIAQIRATKKLFDNFPEGIGYTSEGISTLKVPIRNEFQEYGVSLTSPQLRKLTTVRSLVYLVFSKIPSQYQREL